MRVWLGGVLTLLTLTLAACDEGGLRPSGDQLYAPDIDPSGEAVDPLLVGHRLMDAGEHELALQAFTRAAGQSGLNAEVLSALGSANLALGRLGQAETLLRRAVEAEAGAPSAWNNLGVVLMEKGDTTEAAQVFRRAFALDNGRSDSIRDNLRLAIAKSENSVYVGDEAQDYKLVRRGVGDYVIRLEP